MTLFEPPEEKPFITQAELAQIRGVTKAYITSPMYLTLRKTESCEKNADSSHSPSLPPRGSHESHEGTPGMPLANDLDPGGSDFL